MEEKLPECYVAVARLPDEVLNLYVDKCQTMAEDDLAASMKIEEFNLRRVKTPPKVNMDAFKSFKRKREKFLSRRNSLSHAASDTDISTEEHKIGCSGEKKHLEVMDKHGSDFQSCSNKTEERCPPPIKIRKISQRVHSNGNSITDCKDIYEVESDRATSKIRKHKRNDFPTCSDLKSSRIRNTNRDSDIQKSNFIPKEVASNKIQNVSKAKVEKPKTSSILKRLHSSGSFTTDSKTINEVQTDRATSKISKHKQNFPTCSDFKSSRIRNINRDSDIQKSNFVPQEIASNKTQNVCKAKVEKPKTSSMLKRKSSDSSVEDSAPEQGQKKLKSSLEKNITHSHLDTKFKTHPASKVSDAPTVIKQRDESKRKFAKVCQWCSTPFTTNGETKICIICYDLKKGETRPNCVLRQRKQDLKTSKTRKVCSTSSEKSNLKAEKSASVSTTKINKSKNTESSIKNRSNHPLMKKVKAQILRQKRHETKVINEIEKLCSDPKVSARLSAKTNTASAKKELKNRSSRLKNAEKPLTETGKSNKSFNTFNEITTSTKQKDYGLNCASNSLPQNSKCHEKAIEVFVVHQVKEKEEYSNLRIVDETKVSKKLKNKELKPQNLKNIQRKKEDNKTAYKNENRSESSKKLKKKQKTVHKGLLKPISHSFKKCEDRVKSSNINASKNNSNKMKPSARNQTLNSFNHSKNNKHDLTTLKKLSTFTERKDFVSKKVEDIPKHNSSSDKKCKTLNKPSSIVSRTTTGKILEKQRKLKMILKKLHTGKTKQTDEVLKPINVVNLKKKEKSKEKENRLDSIQDSSSSGKTSLNKDNQTPEKVKLPETCESQRKKVKPAITHISGSGQCTKGSSSVDRTVNKFSPSKVLESSDLGPTVVGASLASTMSDHGEKREEHNESTVASKSNETLDSDNVKQNLENIGSESMKYLESSSNIEEINQKSKVFENFGPVKQNNSRPTIVEEKFSAPLSDIHENSEQQNEAENYLDGRLNSCEVKIFKDSLKLVIKKNSKNSVNKKELKTKSDSFKKYSTSEKDAGLDNFVENVMDFFSDSNKEGEESMKFLFENNFDRKLDAGNIREESDKSLNSENLNLLYCEERIDCYENLKYSTSSKEEDSGLESVVEVTSIPFSDPLEKSEKNKISTLSSFKFEDPSKTLPESHVKYEEHKTFACTKTSNECTVEGKPSSDGSDVLSGRNVTSLILENSQESDSKSNSMEENVCCLIISNCDEQIGSHIKQISGERSLEYSYYPTVVSFSESTFHKEETRVCETLVTSEHINDTKKTEVECIKEVSDESNSPLISNFLEVSNSIITVENSKNFQKLEIKNPLFVLNASNKNISLPIISSVLSLSDKLSKHSGTSEEGLETLSVVSNEDCQELHKLDIQGFNTVLNAARDDSPLPLIHSVCSLTEKHSTHSGTCEENLEMTSVIANENSAEFRKLEIPNPSTTFSGTENPLPVINSVISLSCKHPTRCDNSSDTLEDNASISNEDSLEFWQPEVSNVSSVYRSNSSTSLPLIKSVISLSDKLSSHYDASKVDSEMHAVISKKDIQELHTLSTPSSSSSSPDMTTNPVINSVLSIPGKQLTHSDISEANFELSNEISEKLQRQESRITTSVLSVLNATKDYISLTNSVSNLSQKRSSQFEAGLEIESVINEDGQDFQKLCNQIPTTTLNTTNGNASLVNSVLNLSEKVCTQFDPDLETPSVVCNESSWQNEKLKNQNSSVLSSSIEDKTSSPLTNLNASENILTHVGVNLVAQSEIFNENRKLENQKPSIELNTTDDKASLFTNSTLSLSVSLSSPFEGNLIPHSVISNEDSRKQGNRSLSTEINATNSNMQSIVSNVESWGQENQSSLTELNATNNNMPSAVANEDSQEQENQSPPVELNATNNNMHSADTNSIVSIEERCEQQNQSSLIELNETNNIHAADENSVVSNADSREQKNQTSSPAEVNATNDMHPADENSVVSNNKSWEENQSLLFELNATDNNTHFAFENYSVANDDSQEQENQISPIELNDTNNNTSPLRVKSELNLSDSIASNENSQELQRKVDQNPPFAAKGETSFRAINTLQSGADKLLSKSDSGHELLESNAVVSTGGIELKKIDIHSPLNISKKANDNVSLSDFNSVVSVPDKFSTQSDALKEGFKTSSEISDNLGNNQNLNSGEIYSASPVFNSHVNYLENKNSSDLFEGDICSETNIQPIISESYRQTQIINPSADKFVKQPSNCAGDQSIHMTDEEKILSYPCGFLDTMSLFAIFDLGKDPVSSLMSRLRSTEAELSKLSSEENISREKIADLDYSLTIFNTLKKHMIGHKSFEDVSSFILKQTKVKSFKYNSKNSCNSHNFLYNSVLDTIINNSVYPSSSKLFDNTEAEFIPRGRQEVPIMSWEKSHTETALNNVQESHICLNSDKQAVLPPVEAISTVAINAQDTVNSTKGDSSGSRFRSNMQETSVNLEKAVFESEQIQIKKEPLDTADTSINKNEVLQEQTVPSNSSQISLNTSFDSEHHNFPIEHKTTSSPAMCTENSLSSIYQSSEPQTSSPNRSDSQHAEVIDVKKESMETTDIPLSSCSQQHVQTSSPNRSDSQHAEVIDVKKEPMDSTDIPLSSCSQQHVQTSSPNRSDSQHAEVIDVKKEPMDSTDIPLSSCSQQHVLPETSDQVPQTSDQVSVNSQTSDSFVSETLFSNVTSLENPVCSTYHQLHTFDPLTVATQIPTLDVSHHSLCSTLGHQNTLSNTNFLPHITSGQSDASQSTVPLNVSQNYCLNANNHQTHLSYTSHQNPVKVNHPSQTSARDLCSTNHQNSVNTNHPSQTSTHYLGRISHESPANIVHRAHRSQTFTHSVGISQISPVNESEHFSSNGVRFKNSMCNTIPPLLSSGQSTVPSQVPPSSLSQHPFTNAPSHQSPVCSSSLNSQTCLPSAPFHLPVNNLQRSFSNTDFNQSLNPISHQPVIPSAPSVMRQISPLQLPKHPISNTTSHPTSQQYQISKPSSITSKISKLEAQVSKLKAKLNSSETNVDLQPAIAHNKLRKENMPSSNLQNEYPTYATAPSHQTKDVYPASVGLYYNQSNFLKASVSNGISPSLAVVNNGGTVVVNPQVGQSALSSKQQFWPSNQYCPQYYPSSCQTTFMPSLTPANNQATSVPFEQATCAACRRQAFFKCGRCYKVAYCSQFCSKLYWNTEHKNVCSL